MRHQQLYKCNGCLRKFSNLHRNQKQTDPGVILKSLTLVCRGYSYDQVCRFMLNCDTYTIAAEVPAWMDTDETKCTSNPHCRAGMVENLPAVAANWNAAGRASPIPALHKNPLAPSPGTSTSSNYKFNTLYILDFRRNAVETANRKVGVTNGSVNPRAAKEQKRKVATQLNLYALALAKRANLSLEKIRCSWFDEEDFFSFKPNPYL